MIQRILDISYPSRQPRLLFLLVWKTFFTFTYCILDEQNTISDHKFSIPLFLMNSSCVLLNSPIIELVTLSFRTVVALLATFPTIFEKFERKLGLLSDEFSSETSGCSVLCWPASNLVVEVSSPDP